MTVLAKFAAYDANGRRCGGGSLQLPDYLDWMDIEVKAEYFRIIGQGPDAAYFLILESQGQEKLIPGVTLSPIHFDVYKDRVASAYDQVQQFITEGNYSREPRNQ